MRDSRRGLPRGSCGVPFRNQVSSHRSSPVLVPKLYTTLQGYTRQQFLADLGAGVIVGVVAIPLAIAFAIASGVTPGQGLYTAIVAGLLISVLGGSRVQIGGPTGAFVVIVYGIVQEHGYDGLAVATMMAGLILIGLGLAKLGGVIKFIPFPIITGFTSGIAVIIAVSQLRDLLGLEMEEVPAEFFAKFAAYGEHLSTANGAAIGVASLSLAILVFWPKLAPRVPAPFVALIGTTALASLAGLDVETVGSRFGALQTSLPAPSLPDISWGTLTALVGPAFTIAMLGAIESLLSAVVADGMIGGKHRSNMELVAQGVANIASPLFGGIPATGAIARTATNIKNGGRTPVAGIVHALTLLLIMTFFGRWAALIPMATLGAILLVVAYHMSEWRVFRSELRGAPRSDVLVMLTTFVLTVAIDLTVAIQVGMVLAAFLFMKRMAEVTNVSAITREMEEGEDSALSERVVPQGVEVYAIDGPFFFGAAEKFRETLGQVGRQPRVLIIQMQRVPAIDSTGIHALRDVVRRTLRNGTLVILAGVHAQPMVALGRSPLLDEVGEENLCGGLEDALERARQYLAEVPPPAARR